MVVNVLVKEGQQVREGETLLELENQKAVAPIPSTVSGTVTKIHVKQGDLLSVGQVLVSISEQAGRVAPLPSGSAPKAAPVPPVAPEEGEYHSPSGAPPPVSPSVRKMAMELGIDLRRVRGSERGGRITSADVRAHVARLQAPGRQDQPVPEKMDFQRWGPVHRKPISGLRKAIAAAMVRSWTTIPHVTQFDEADVSALLKQVEQYAPLFEKKNSRLTLTTVLIRALVPVLEKYPVFNSSWDEAAGEVVFKDYIHLGIAVDTEAGLIVPVLRDVQKKDLRELGRELPALVEKARRRQLSGEDLQGGSFTLSNQGGIGGRHFTPIVHEPEVAILGVGRTFEGKLPLSLSYDHRAIDGADAARFITALVEQLQHFPEQELQR